MLCAAGKSLTPSQQAWDPLSLEGHAQLMMKRYQNKILGYMRSQCWTDHANWTRQGDKVDIDVKHLRWYSEIVADGSEIRSLSGRTAVLGDGISRNPIDRDEVMEQRSKDLRGYAGQIRGFNLDVTSFSQTGKTQECQYLGRLETIRCPVQLRIKRQRKLASCQERRLVPRDQSCRHQWQWLRVLGR